VKNRIGCPLAMIFGFLAATSFAQAASFNCEKANTKAEQLICDNQGISELDSKLNERYQRILSKANVKQRQQIISNQKHWLKHRRNVCADISCMTNTYAVRVRELDEIFASFSSQENEAKDGIRTVTMHSGDEIYLFGNHLIKTSAVKVEVYDSVTYQPIDSIFITGYDEIYQDNIINLAYRNGKYYASVVFNDVGDTTTKSRITLAVIDANTLKIIKTYSTIDIANSDFIPPEAAPQRSKFLLDSNLGEIHLKHSNQPFLFTISLENNNGKPSQLLFNAETWHENNGLLHQENSFSNAVVIGHILVIGMNRDLYVIDVKNQKYRALIEYQQNGFNNNGFGVDNNRIEHLAFDERTNRLLVFCFEGIENSFLSLVELESLPDTPLQAPLPITNPQRN